MDHLEKALERARRRKELPAPVQRRLLRMRAGITLADVARCLGTTVAAVSRYERGEREPRPAIMVRYLRILERLQKN